MTCLVERSLVDCTRRKFASTAQAALVVSKPNRACARQREDGEDEDPMPSSKGARSPGCLLLEDRNRQARARPTATVLLRQHLGPA